MYKRNSHLPDITITYFQTIYLKSKYRLKKFSGTISKGVKHQHVTDKFVMP